LLLAWLVWVEGVVRARCDVRSIHAAARGSGGGGVAWLRRVAAVRASSACGVCVVHCVVWAL